MEMSDKEGVGTGVLVHRVSARPPILRGPGLVVVVKLTFLSQQSPTLRHFSPFTHALLSPLPQSLGVHTPTTPLNVLVGCFSRSSVNDDALDLSRQRVFELGRTSGRTARAMAPGWRYMT